jgi:hypothetical protein
LLFEKAGVKCVCIIYEVLKVFKGEWGGEGGAAEGFEKLMERVSPKTNDNIIFRRDIA